MAGGVSSLNVSAAGAVVLYEAFRQRRAASRMTAADRSQRSPRSGWRVKTSKTERSRFMKSLCALAYSLAALPLCLASSILFGADPAARNPAPKQTTPQRRKTLPAR